MMQWLPLALGVAALVAASPDYGTLLGSPLEWQSTGSSNVTWIDGGSTFRGSKFACSGVLSDSIQQPQNSEIFTENVEGPQVISFWWKVSCESASDKLQLKVNSKIKGQITPGFQSYVSNTWEKYSFEFPEGNNTLRFDYIKDAQGSEGEDRGCISSVQVGPPTLSPTMAPTLNPTLNPTSPTSPTNTPTSSPSVNPSASPTTNPSLLPTGNPSTPNPSIAPETVIKSDDTDSVSLLPTIGAIGGAIFGLFCIAMGCHYFHHESEEKKLIDRNRKAREIVTSETCVEAKGIVRQPVDPLDEKSVLRRKKSVRWTDLDDSDDDSTLADLELKNLSVVVVGDSQTSVPEGAQQALESFGRLYGILRQRAASSSSKGSSTDKKAVDALQGIIRLLEHASLAVPVTAKLLELGVMPLASVLEESGTSKAEQERFALTHGITLRLLNLALSHSAVSEDYQGYYLLQALSAAGIVPLALNLSRSSQPLFSRLQAFACLRYLCFSEKGIEAVAATLGLPEVLAQHITFGYHKSNKLVALNALDILLMLIQMPGHANDMLRRAGRSCVLLALVALLHSVTELAARVNEDEDVGRLTEAAIGGGNAKAASNSKHDVKSLQTAVKLLPSPSDPALEEWWSGHCKRFGERGRHGDSHAHEDGEHADDDEDELEQSEADESDDEDEEAQSVEEGSPEWEKLVLQRLEAERGHAAGAVVARALTQEYLSKRSPAHRLRLLKCLAPLTKMRQGGVRRRGFPGCWAGSQADYDDFRPFFEKVIAECHNGGNQIAGTDGQPHSNWALPEEMGGDGKRLDVQALGLDNVDVDVRVRRNIIGLPLIRDMTLEQRVHCEEIICKGLSAVNGMSGGFSGQYYSLTDGHPDFVVDKSREELADTLANIGEPVRTKHSTLLEHWPAGRGFYITEDKSLMVVVGGEDHVVVLSMARGQWINSATSRAKAVLRTLAACLEEHEEDHHGFVWHAKWGCITTNPFHTGPGVTISAVAHLPNLAASKGSAAKALRSSTHKFAGVRTRIAPGTKRISLTVQGRLGKTEGETIALLYQSLEQLAAADRKCGPPKAASAGGGGADAELKPDIPNSPPRNSIGGGQPETPVSPKEASPRAGRSKEKSRGRRSRSRGRRSLSRPAQSSSPSSDGGYIMKLATQSDFRFATFTDLQALGKSVHLLGVFTQDEVGKEQFAAAIFEDCQITGNQRSDLLRLIASYLKCPVEEIKKAILHIIYGLFAHKPSLRILDNSRANPSMFDKSLMGGFVALLMQAVDLEEDEDDESIRLILEIIVSTMYSKDGLVHANRLHFAVSYGIVPVLVELLLEDVDDVDELDINHPLKKNVLQLLLIVGQAKRLQTQIALRTVKAQRALLKLMFRLVVDQNYTSRAFSFISVWLFKDKSKSAEKFMQGRSHSLIEACLAACDRMEHSDDADAGQALNIMGQILKASPPLARAFESNASFVGGLFDFISDDRSPIHSCCSMLIILHALVEHSPNPDEFTMHYSIREKLEPLSLDGSVKIAKLARTILDTISEQREI